MMKDEVWLDGYTKVCLGVMFLLLAAIFVAAEYMGLHHMDGTGTDDIVTAMAGATAHAQPHPFVELPGDAQVGAFSVANFFAGLIVGHHWNGLFGSLDKR